MPALSITSHNDNGTVVVTVEPSDGPLAVAAFRHHLLADGARFAPTLIGLTGALANLAVWFGPEASRLQPQALQDEVRKQVARMVGPQYRDSRDKVRGAKRDEAAREVRIHEVPAQLPFAAEDRADFRSLDLSGQVAWINTASRDQLAALVGAGQARFPKLPEPLWTQIVERHAVLAHIDKTGLQAGYQLQPTPESPAAVGPDMKAAEEASRAAAERRRDDLRAIKDAEAALRQVIVVVSVATGLSVDDAFALLDKGEV